VSGYNFSQALGTPGSFDFFFIRHGESVGNREHIIQGHTDYPLSERGKSHARAAGEWFTQEPPGLIFSSPLGRASETAQIIAQEVGIAGRKIRFIDELKELHTGSFTGRPMKEIQTTDPDLWERFSQEGWGAVPQAESIESAETRSKKVWDLVTRSILTLPDPARKNRWSFFSFFRNPPDPPSEAPAPQPRRVLSVTHGGILQWILKVTWGQNYTQWMPVIRAGNCGIFHLRVSVSESSIKKASPNVMGFAEWKRINFLPYQ